MALTRGSHRWRDWEAYALVFGSSLCTLVLELVAGRLLAPTIGVSLFTWTSVIGIVLAGVAVGNYLGGRVARRSASPRVLAGVLIASSLVTWGDALLVHAMDLDTLFSTLTPLTRIITLVSALFFLPSALLGTVTPLVAQLTLHDRAEAGAVVGRLGAVSAAGSIAGTFLTGFWLVPTFGTRAILGGVAAALLTLAVLALWGRASAPKPGEATFLVTVLALAAAVTGFAYTRDKNACLRETAYYCSRVIQTDTLGPSGPIQYGVLLHDRIIQGYTAPDEPRLVIGAWTQVFAEVAAYQASTRPGSGSGIANPAITSTAIATGTSAHNNRSDVGPLRSLFIGGGSFTVPRYLEAVYPDSHSDVLEIDSGVTLTATEKLGLRAGNGIQVTHGDARTTLRNVPSGGYDLVYGDAFNDMAVPWHLTTTEFATEVRRVLHPDGIYAINIIDAWPRGGFLAAFFRTLQDVFPHVLLLRTNGNAISPGDPDALAASADVLDNWVVLASTQPIDVARLERVSRPAVGVSEPARARVVPEVQVSRWLAERQPPVLRDDFAPVDRLLAERLLR